MKALTLKLVAHNQARHNNLPTTPRGRALYTIDWFMNGRPVLNNHDNPNLTLKNGIICE